MSDKNKETILVTGANGFIALHVINQFALNGYRVRGTVRNLKDEKKLESIKKIESKYPIEIVEANLLDADCWKKILADVSIVMHVASPFPPTNPTDEYEIIGPALDGTLNVLKAAHEAKNVKRVIVTSSFLAVCGYEREPNKTYAEKDWPDLNKMSFAYGKSKVLGNESFTLLS